MLLKGADKMAKNDQKCWSQPGFIPGAFEREKKNEKFRLKLYHFATKALHKEWSKYCNYTSKQQTLFNEYGTWPRLHLKCIKVTFFNKQIIEIKKKLHIDPIFTYYKVQIRL